MLGESAQRCAILRSSQDDNSLQVALLVSTTAMKNDSQNDTPTSSFSLEAEEGHA
jgi:hypothetical protein